MKQTYFLLMILLIGLVGCGAETAVSGGMGMGGGMRARHHATLPDEYAGLTNPVAADEASLARGGETYETFCATCHGDGGMGDGPAAAGLDPAPAPLAHTGQMMGEDYLYWRVSEGGLGDPFNSAMPAWKASLDEEVRWDVVNYIQALGRGDVVPRGNMGGATFDPAAEAARHAEMAAAGVAQGLFSQADADTFTAVHAEMDRLMADGMEMSGGPTEAQAAMLSALVDEGAITKAEAETFDRVHEALLGAGLME